MEGAGPKHRLGGDRSLDSLLRSQLSHSYKVWRTELCRFLRNIVVALMFTTALMVAVRYKDFSDYAGPKGVSLRETHSYYHAVDLHDVC